MYPDDISLENKFFSPYRVKPDDFEFRTCIGKGSFGKVYLARHKTEDMIYAVKVVSKALIKRKREERHIMAERDVLVKNTRHPFFVSLLFLIQNLHCDLYFSCSFIYNKNVHLVNNARDSMLQKLLRQLVIFINLILSIGI
jgi:serine/threonine protein kinase